MEKIFIIDAVNFLFRSYYAIGPMTNDQGQSTSALYGFIRSIQKMQNDFSFSHMAVVFDGPDNKKSRREVYADYKMHRKGAPEDLYPQFNLAYEYCQKAGLFALSISGVEGPMRNGNARGSSGQIIMGFKEFDTRGYNSIMDIQPAIGWNNEMLFKFFYDFIQLLCC